MNRQLEIYQTYIGKIKQIEEKLTLGVRYQQVKNELCIIEKQLSTYESVNSVLKSSIVSNSILNFHQLKKWLIDVNTYLSKEAVFESLFLNLKNAIKEFPPLLDANNILQVLTKKQNELFIEDFEDLRNKIALNKNNTLQLYLLNSEIQQKCQYHTQIKASLSDLYANDKIDYEKYFQLKSENSKIILRQYISI